MLGKFLLFFFQPLGFLPKALFLLRFSAFWVMTFLDLRFPAAVPLTLNSDMGGDVYFTNAFPAIFYDLRLAFPPLVICLGGCSPPPEILPPFKKDHPVG